MFTFSKVAARCLLVSSTHVTRRRKRTPPKLNCRNCTGSTPSFWSRCLANVGAASTGVLQLISALSLVFCVTLPCHALNGLVDLPLTHPLRNNYYLVRAGESIADARGTVESNPVDKTSVAKSGLTARGAQQARAAADQLVQQLGFCQKTAQCWIWPSMTLNAYETGEIIGDKALLGHERIVPEFSYLDKRGFGAFNGASTREVMPQVHAQDRMNAQRRPPPGDDGTPPESIFDVFIRVRQLLSKLETQYGTQGADVVIVAPDTYPLSILECMLNGEPLEHFDQHLYAPGEVHRVPNPKVFPILESSRPHEQVNWANIQRVRQTTTSGN